LLGAFDRLSVPEAAALVHPDAKLSSPLLDIWDEHASGHDGLRRWFTRLQREWAFQQVRVLEVFEQGDWVIAHIRVRGRGIASPTELTWQAFATFRFADGLVTEFTVNLERPSAWRQLQPPYDED
jgi:predicted SnoaL-like aldol condensation-catalyzing enzyme